MTLQQTTVPRTTGIQAMYGAMAALAVGLPLATVLAGPRTGSVPVWLGLVAVLVVGSVALLTVYFWKIRPIAPGRLGDYAKTVALRAGVAALPAVVGFGLSFATGGWAVPLLGILLAVPGLAATTPGTADYARHLELWFEVGDMPSDGVWGTADPHEVPPWEDPDGGHGHGIGPHSHGLH